MGFREMPYASPLDPAIISQSGLVQPQHDDDNALAFFRSKNGRTDGTIADNQLQYLRSRTGLTTGSISDAFAEFRRQGLSFGVVTPQLTNSVAPAASGSTTQGSTLTATNGTWSATPDSYTYQWRRAGSPISGATAATYATQVADVGFAVDCLVTAVKAAYTSGSQATNAITVVAAPSNTLSESFGGADGSAWPTQWTTVAAGGAATQQSGGGRLTSSTTPYTGGSAAYTKNVSAADMDVTFDLSFPVIAEEYLIVALRGNSPVSATDTITGYYVNFYPGNTVNSGGIFKNTGSGATAISGDLGLGQFVAGVKKRFRFKVSGTTIQLKTWDPANAEPGTWFFTGTDATITAAGRLVINMACGADGVQRAGDIDNIVIA